LLLVGRVAGYTNTSCNKEEADIDNVRVDDTHIKLTLRLIKWLNSEFVAQICFMFDSEQTQSCVIVFKLILVTCVQLFHPEMTQTKKIFAAVYQSMWLLSFKFILS